MKEYLIDSGGFNIIVLPDLKKYFILAEDESSRKILASFLAGEAVAYESLQPLWFKYSADEAWTSIDGKRSGCIGEDLKESDLIDYFVLKKHNFGSLVAVRDLASGKVQVFKRDKVAIA